MIRIKKVYATGIFYSLKYMFDVLHEHLQNKVISKDQLKVIKDKEIYNFKNATGFSYDEILEEFDSSREKALSE